MKTKTTARSGTEEDLWAQGRRDMLADIELWKGLVRSRGRDAVIGDLVRGDTCTWLGEDTDHRLYIKAADGAGAKARLGSYDDAELGEWFSLATVLVLAQTIMQVGMAWKCFGKGDPVLLAECPSLEELRTHCRRG